MRTLHAIFRWIKADIERKSGLRREPGTNCCGPCLCVVQFWGLRALVGLDPVTEAHVAAAECVSSAEPLRRASLMASALRCVGGGQLSRIVVCQRDAGAACLAIS
jgi:hypothetical protein